MNGVDGFSVSMCVCGKDNPEWFKTAVESVLNQTLKPAEIVLVVDGPVPELLEQVIAEYERKDFFKVIKLSENCGHGVARRTGLENCSCELVALMDADDISLPERFEKQFNVFKDDSSLSIVGGQISEFVETEENIVGYRIVPNTHEEICTCIKKRCPFNQVSVMFKKTDVQSVGGYQDWYCNEDYYLWIRMHLADMKFSNVSDTLVNVRVGQDMYKRRGGWKYFKSEKKLQKYMLENHVIGAGAYFVNVLKRFIVQVMLTDTLRGIVFKKFARKQVK